MAKMSKPLLMPSHEPRRSQAFVDISSEGCALFGYVSSTWSGDDYFLNGG